MSSSQVASKRGVRRNAQTWRHGTWRQYVASGGQGLDRTCRQNVSSGIGRNVHPRGRPPCKFKRLSFSKFPILRASSGLSQSRQIPTSFLFEVSHFACEESTFNRPSPSRFPILCASWGLLQRKQILAPIFFEVTYFVCIWDFLQYKKIQALFLFEVSYLVCILGPFAKQANSNALPLQRFPCCVHLETFCRASKLKCRYSSRFPMLRSSFRRASKFNVFPL